MKQVTVNDLIDAGWQIRQGYGNAMQVVMPDGSYYGEWMKPITHDEIWALVVRELNTGNFAETGFSFQALFSDRRAYRESRPAHDLTILEARHSERLAAQHIKAKSRKQEQKALKELGLTDVS